MYLAQSALLKKLQGTSILTDEDIVTLTQMDVRARNIKRRHDIISEGDDPTYVHLVEDGWAARYQIMPSGKRQITAFLLPGDFCDIHVTVLGRMDHGIIAITECKVAYVETETIQELTSRSPSIARALWRGTLVDEAILRVWIANNGRRGALEAVAHLLSELHVRLSVIGLAEHNRFTLPLTQEEIADATGLTPVHVNRMFSQLRQDGIVTTSGKDVEILRVEELHNLAGFDERYLHLRRS